ncbi:MAG TPA: Appr-1-p processing protein, partial [Bacillota bacterium]|nr:Appr-1-p processing protein [Bacillota bacterium]
SWYWLKDGFELGNVDFVAVEPDILVANMIGQHGIDSTDDFPSLRYDAVDSCLAKVADKAKELDASIHWSRFGCGRWELIEPLLRKNLVERGVAVYVYDGNERSKPND